MAAKRRTSLTDGGGVEHTAEMNAQTDRFCFGEQKELQRTYKFSIQVFGVGFRLLVRNLRSFNYVSKNSVTAKHTRGRCESLLHDNQ